MFNVNGVGTQGPPPLFFLAAMLDRNKGYWGTLNLRSGDATGQYSWYTLPSVGWERHEGGKRNDYQAGLAGESV